MEKYKRAFLRHHKLMYVIREKRSVPDYWNSLLDSNSHMKLLENSRLEPDQLPQTKGPFRRKLRIQKRGLKGGSGSRAVGIGHKISTNRLNSRRGNKKIKTSEAFDKTQKHKYRVPCESLSTEPYVNVEIVKHGKNHNVSFGSGTVVKMACGKGYTSNLPTNKTAKCVRGKWRPEKPSCFISEYSILKFKIQMSFSRPASTDAFPVSNKLV